MFLGIPIGFALVLSSTLAFILLDYDALVGVAQRLYATNDSFPLLAIPFFILTGEIMLQGGISRKIVGFVAEFFVWVKEALVVVTFVACTFFGAISGSAFATTAAIGSFLYPEMVKKGYEADFAATIQAVGGTIGILIPPSIPLVVYGVLSQTSIGDLFLATIPVGLLVCLVYILTSLILLRRKNREYLNIGEMKPKINLARLIVQAKDAIWALFAPIIILGGIYSGIFTPTESAIVATVYSLIIGVFIYKSLTYQEIYRSFVQSGIVSATIMFIIDSAGVFGWILTVNNIPHLITEIMLGFVASKLTLLLVVNVVFLIAGMFMETISILTILVPLFYPIVHHFGLNPIHFVIIAVFNLSLGAITPPFGGCDFVASGITGVSVSAIFQRVIPFVVAGVISLLLVTYIPLLFLG
jgi:C4-dicarboxylate transporter DctM subunit